MTSGGKHERRDHERTDWNLNWVVGGAVALVVCVAVFLLVAWWMFKTFEYTAANRQLGTATGPPMAPPEPRLQVSPSDDWAAMLQKEQAALHSYGWVDRSKGIVRIPIDREMELIAKRGFPGQPASGGQTK